jgi:hypothetical protein
MYRTLAWHMKQMTLARLRGDVAAAFEHELWVWFFAGALKQRWADRHVAVPPPQVNTPRKIHGMSPAA